MAKPQQPELRRSSHTFVDTERHAKETVGPPPADDGSRGPVPEAGRPGHHPERDQDKPDLERLRERLSGGPAARGTATEEDA